MPRLNPGLGCWYAPGLLLFFLSLAAGPEFPAGAGLALFRPYPLPVWNLEALYRLELRVGRSRRTSLDLIGGISGSTCPAYRRLAAPYTVIDFPLSLSVSF